MKRLYEANLYLGARM